MHSSYSELIQKLFHVNLFGGVKLGLQNAERLQQLLHYPDRHFKTIHVAGTNGKGSVSTKIAYALEEAGYRVGLYTSPHISTFRERIRINGLMISEDAVEKLLTFLFQLLEKEHIPATFFEITTMLAFLHFAHEKVDVAVLETGLGGRLDATNIVHPCLAIITSISLDHVEILGTTQESIAYEKGGIIKEKVPVIIGPSVPVDIMQSIAREKQSPCTQVSCSSILFEEENQHIAYTALQYLSSTFKIPNQAIKKGLEGRQPCRFEIIPGTFPIVLDVAHNPDGIQHLFQMLKHYYPDRQYRILFGLSKNKDLKNCLKLIAIYCKYFHLVQATNERGTPTKILYDQLIEFEIHHSCISLHDSISTGIDQAKEEALKKGEVLVICGSFFIMSQARQALGFIEPRDQIDLN